MNEGGGIERGPKFNRLKADQWLNVKLTDSLLSHWSTMDFSCCANLQDTGDQWKGKVYTSV